MSTVWCHFVTLLSTGQEINIPRMLAKFENNCWAWHCNSVRSQFSNLFAVPYFGIGVSHLDQCRREAGNIVTGSVIINAWQVTVISNLREAGKLLCIENAFFVSSLKCFTLMLHFFEKKNWLTLKIFTQMRDDAMMIPISVKQPQQVYFKLNIGCKACARN